jgi:hypothetical protein
VFKISSVRGNLDRLHIRRREAGPTDVKLPAVVSTAVDFPLEIASFNS